MDVTVIIPNYNGMKYIDNCLKSIISGSVVPKIIVVDNGSSDGSMEFIKENYPQIKLKCFLENQGFCKAVNAGIVIAETEFVLLLNNDTTVDRYFVERMQNAIKIEADTFSVGAKMLSMKQPELIDNAGDLYCALGWAFALGQGKSSDCYTRRTKIFAACAGAAIYKKSLFDDIGYFDENHFAYLEDIDIGYRARIKGYNNYFEPEAIVYHAGSAVSGGKHNAFKVSLSSRNSIYLIYKNMPLWQIVLNVPFFLIGFLVKMLFFAKKGLGKTYIEGIRNGFRLSSSQKGKENKVSFGNSCLKYIIQIQVELWMNMMRKIMG